MEPDSVSAQGRDPRHNTLKGTAVMSEHVSIASPLAVSIIDRVEALILDAEQETKPLEVDPYRGQLFELFVTAEAAGYVCEEADPDLTSDGLCRILAQRWQLADAARNSMEQQTRLSGEQLARMRMLWSVMRMWMEWDYAWSRWPEFRDESRCDSAE
jgi:hypothetical protein